MKELEKLMKNFISFIEGETLILRQRLLILETDTLLRDLKEEVWQWERKKEG